MSAREAPIPTAILGASGYIGQHFARLLDDHPFFAPPLLVGSDRSAGKRLEELWQLPEEVPAGLGRERLRPLGPRELRARGVRVVFGALPSGTAGVIESECQRRGIHVFSNSADHRMDADVPLLVPEVNAAHLRALVGLRRRGGLLVNNPNCTTTGLVLGLAPIWRLVAPREVHLASYQALSGAGFPGVASLTITDNVVPFIREEEEKVAEETQRILGTARNGRIRPRPEPVLAQCARVGVRDGHLEAITVVARRRPSRAQLVEAWRRFDPLAGRALPTLPHPPIVLRPEADRPQPVRDRWAGTPHRARGMAVSIGRVRWEPPYLRFYLLVHNAVRGGAGGSVSNAELADADGLLDAGGTAA
jgi:aspartate-semialdehyde dehydrogenase